MFKRQKQNQILLTGALTALVLLFAQAAQANCALMAKQKERLNTPKGPVLVNKYTENELLDMGCPGRYTPARTASRETCMQIACNGGSLALQNFTANKCTMVVGPWSSAQAVCNSKTPVGGPQDPNVMDRFPPRETASQPPRDLFDETGMPPMPVANKPPKKPVKKPPVKPTGPVEHWDFDTDKNKLPQQAEKPPVAPIKPPSEYVGDLPTTFDSPQNNSSPEKPASEYVGDLPTVFDSPQSDGPQRPAVPTTGNTGAPIANKPPAPASAASQPDKSAVPDLKDNDSFLKKHMWGNSFDEASDASKDAALEAGTCGGSDEACKAAMQTAADISNTQATFANVSRVSDAAALAAVGGSIVSEVAIRDDSQAGSLKKVRNIHKVASKAQFVAGATDITLGAAAYLDQAKRLEEQKKNLEEQLKNPELSGKERKAIIAKYNIAVKKTQEASMKHIGWGVAKIGAGALSNAAAKSADGSLKALENQPRPYVATPSIGAIPQYQNNAPMFGTQGTSGALVGTNSPPIYNTGGSVASTDTRKVSGGTPSAPFVSTGGSIGNVSSKPSSAGGIGASGSSRGPAAVGVQPVAGIEKDNEITYGSGGGGSSTYKGGKASSDSGGFTSLVSSLVGSEQNQAMPETATEVAGALDDAAAGIVSAEHSLFEQVRAKHVKALASGNLAGMKAGAK